MPNDFVEQLFDESASTPHEGVGWPNYVCRQMVTPRRAEVTAPELVLLHVGGVLLLPDGEVVAGAVRAAGVEPVRTADPLLAHYRAVARIDAAPSGSAAAWDIFTSTWLEALGVEPDDPLAVEAIRELVAEPAPGLWRFVTPWARSGLRSLGDAGVALGAVSNADGTVASQLVEHELAQVGDGPGAELDVMPTEVVDNG